MKHATERFVLPQKKTLTWIENGVAKSRRFTDIVFIWPDGRKVTSREMPCAIILGAESSDGRKPLFIATLKEATSTSKTDFVLMVLFIVIGLALGRAIFG